MDEYYHSAVSRLGAHPILISFIFFAVSAFISIYASEVRRFLHGWPRTHKTLLLVRRTNAVNTLNLLNRLHNNAYQLLIYFMWSIVDAVADSVYINGFFIIITSLAAKKLNTISLWPTMAGVFLSNAFRVKTTLKQLQDYDNSVKKFEQQIRSYEALEKTHLEDPQLKQNS